MCYHNSMFKRAKALGLRYQRKIDFIENDPEELEEQYHVSAFRYPLFPVVTADEEIQAYHWGLIPFWTKSAADAREIRNKTINVRAETIFTKPSFRYSIRAKRCIVPSTGFFDWRHEAGKKIPYFIYVKDEEIFSIAGVYDSWRNPETGASLYTFSIITTAANELMSCIHNTNYRMPAILLKEEEEKWLYPELNKTEIESILKPFEDGRMDAYVIDNNFLRKNAGDPSIICPKDARDTAFNSTEK